MRNAFAYYVTVTVQGLCTARSNQFVELIIIGLLAEWHTLLAVSLPSQ